MTQSQVGNRKAEVRMEMAAIASVFCLVLTTGCQQKMADQPAHRPYEVSTMFPNGQSVRPLQTGVIHRNQPLSDDPLVTWLTTKGKAPEHTENYKAWLTGKSKPTKADNGQDIPAFTQSDIDGLLATKPLPGAPNDNANFVDTVPFEMTKDDLLRGQVLYTAVCAECHGGAGWGNGKIPERGFLRPPSYHTDPEGKAKDWSTHAVQKDGSTAPDFTGNPQGTSRGFYKYGIEQPLKDVNIGYIYQVIYWGYGGMASHETQVPKPEDRWRVAAYVRALQLSQAADVSKLPANSHAKTLIENIGKPKAEAKHSEDKH
jgi:mono/diheme cytochrome c family protein